MSMLPPEYLEGVEVGETLIERELEELADYRDEEIENPHTTIGCRWTWGNQFVVGIDPFSREPKHLPYRAVVRNLSVEGPVGTGKTSRVILPTTVQAIANRNISKVIYLTFEDSPGAIATLELEGYWAGRRVRRVSNVPGDATFGLPLLQQSIESGIPSLQIATTIIDSIGFHQSTKDLSVAYLVAANQLRPGQQTFAELLRALLTHEPAREFSESFRDSREQLTKPLGALASANFLNCQGAVDDIAMIDIRKFATSETPELLILKMNPGVYREVARAVPQLILLLIAQAIQSLKPTEDVRIWFAVDGAENFFLPNVCNCLASLQSRGVGFVYSLNDTSALFDEQTLASFRNNTATKIELACDSVGGLDRIKRFGGDELQLLSQSFRTGHRPDPMSEDVTPERHLAPEYYPFIRHEGELIRNVTAESMHNTVGPRSRFSDNDVLAYLSQPGHGFVRSAINRDLWQQFGMEIPLYFDFCTTEHENNRRRGLPWIVAPGTIPATYTDAFADLIRQHLGRANVRQGARWRNLEQQ